MLPPPSPAAGWCVPDSVLLSWCTASRALSPDSPLLPPPWAAYEPADLPGLDEPPFSSTSLYLASLVPLLVPRKGATGSHPRWLQRPVGPAGFSRGAGRAASLHGPRSGRLRSLTFTPPPTGAPLPPALLACGRQRAAAAAARHRGGQPHPEPHDPPRGRCPRQRRAQHAPPPPHTRRDRAGSQLPPRYRGEAGSAPGGRQNCLRSPLIACSLAFGAPVSAPPIATHYVTAPCDAPCDAPYALPPTSTYRASHRPPRRRRRPSSPRRQPSSPPQPRAQSPTRCTRLCSRCRLAACPPHTAPHTPPPPHTMPRHSLPRPRPRSLSFSRPLPCSNSGALAALHAHSPRSFPDPARCDPATLL